jgi:hypothetical protein
MMLEQRHCRTLSPALLFSKFPPNKAVDFFLQ